MHSAAQRARRRESFKRTCMKIAVFCVRAEEKEKEILAIAGSTCYSHIVQSEYLKSICANTNKTKEKFFGVG